MLKFLITSLLSILLFSTTVCAEVFRYVDSEGHVHFVTDAEKVPAEYKEQVSNPVKLPEVTKVKQHKYKVRKSSADTKKYYRKLRTGEVEVFVTAWCGYCRKLEAFLDTNKVRYRKYDIDIDAKGKKIYEDLGLRGGVPVTKIGDKIIKGFNEQKLRKALGL